MSTVRAYVIGAGSKGIANAISVCVQINAYVHDLVKSGCKTLELLNGADKQKLGVFAVADVCIYLMIACKARGINATILGFANSCAANDVKTGIGRGYLEGNVHIYDIVEGENKYGGFKVDDGKMIPVSATACAVKANPDIVLVFGDAGEITSNEIKVLTELRFKLDKFDVVSAGLV